MLKQDFLKALEELGLTQAEAARLLSVNIRTVRRWSENPDEIPGPAEQALLAWLRLHQIGMPWRPDGVDSMLSDPDQIAEQIMKYRNHAIQLAKILEKVEERGGPAAPWKVDLKKHVAILGPMRLGFYTLLNGGFSPSTYSRTDCEPDVSRDWTLLEDAFKCISDAITKQKK
jgi:hypothetical protein